MKPESSHRDNRFWTGRAPAKSFSPEFCYAVKAEGGLAVMAGAKSFMVKVPWLS